MNSSKRKSKSGAVVTAACAVIESLEGRVLLSTTLNDVADTFVRNNDYALTNFGASPVLFVKNAANGDTRYAFLMFNLTGVTTINSATLQLSGALENSLATPVATGVFPVADTTWVEGSGTIVDSVGDGFDTSDPAAGAMTWNNQPAIGATALGSATINRDTFQTYTVDVTAYLQQQLAAGATLVSFALENLQPTTYETEFLSRESTANYGAAPELIIGDNNPAPPTAVISAPDITADGPNESVTVTYSGATPIDPTTISSSNIVVTPYGGGSPLNVEANPAVTDNADGSVTAIYTVDAPDAGGSWTSADNGNYVVTVPAGSVDDTSATPLGVSQAFGSFHIAVDDTTPPTATITSAPDVDVAGGSAYVFNVTYTDDVAVDQTSITLANVAVSGPVGPLEIASYSVAPGASPNQVVATYTAVAPNSAWNSSDDGAYTVTVNTDQVFDTAGNPSPGTVGSFNVAIPVPDTTPPTAIITAPNITAPGGSDETITVVYSDNVAVQASTIAAGDITVTGPMGALLPVTLTGTSGSGATITATYTVNAPGGAWSAADNGAYTVSVVAGQVTDTSGNPIAASSAMFTVSAAVADTVPPVAAISAPSITVAGGQSETITVVYTDNVAVQTSTIGVANLSVSGPAGPLTVTAFSFTGSGATVTATYTVTAPGAGWDAGANGTYNIALNANEVRDTSGNPAAVTFGSFSVNIPLPDPSDTTFNGGNAVTGPFVAEDVATQPNGQILLVGHELSATGANEGVVERLNADGSLDSTFGTAGQVVTPSGSTEWFAVMIQGADHFVVAGTDGGNFALARYDFSGNLDPTFGTDGVALTSFGGTNDTAYAVALAPNGQIVAVGSSNNRFAFARYDANGNIDMTFGEGGRQLFDTGASVQVLGSVAILNDGRVVAAGSSGSTIDVVRLTSTGEPDTTFSTDGVVAVPGLTANQASGADYTVALAVQSNGDIVVANQTTSGHFGVVRLNTDGTLDTTFGDAGIATANFGGEDEADSLVIQPDGAILAVGTSLQGSDALTAVAAFDTSGDLITSFGNNGLVTFASATSSTTRELHIGDLVLRAFGGGTTDGKLLVGSSSSGAQTVSSALRRIIVPGTTSAPGIQESLLGVFGIVNGKKTNLVVDLGGGRSATFTLTGATGTALQAGTNIHLEITDLGPGATLNMKVKGGGTVDFSDITVTGNLKLLNAPLAIVNGSLSVTGSAGKIILGALPGSIAVTQGMTSLQAGALSGTISAGGNVKMLKLGAVSGQINVSGNLSTLAAGDVSGSIYAGGEIGHAKVGNLTGLIDSASLILSLNAMSLSGATVLAGDNLGSDGLLGGSGSAADTYAAGTIDLLKVSGAIANSFVGAGVTPGNGGLGAGHDTSAGASLIKSVFAKHGATGSHFESSAFGVVKLPGATDPATNPQFTTL